MKFAASLDKMCITVTVVTTLFFAYVCLAEVFPIDSKFFVRLFPIALIMPIPYFYCLFMRPQSYEVMKDYIVVKRPFSDWRLYRDSVKTLRELERNELDFTIRLFGVGALFGYFGYFRNSRLGTFRMFATRCNKGVLIETIANKKIVITPDNPQQFVAYYNTLIHEK